MRHCPSVPSPCQPHIIVLLLAGFLAHPSPSRAQTAIDFGFTRQRVSAGNRRESLDGYNAAVAFRVARRVGLLIGGEQIGHDGSATRDEYSVDAFRTGLQLSIARSRLLEVNLAAGVGLHSLNLDREEDGAGASVFVQAGVAFHPLPVVGLYIGAIAQSLGGFGTSIGGSTLGFNIGLQLRSDGW